ncbi:hypothetical protein [Geomesophilobacter sediminis]|uniref:Uncharacterized protein n=1 Tax=Geomesophilobacter sediminis TaxID=2798584 RepID=A0A8J7S935_9BACT|nr:hypothetical protein [Geomesophilobacter sediminis]MBJ6726756.1 hypothetical protein [Geomesophilobacter sediminis]
MRRSTVRYGLKLILAGILCVTAGTFFHSEIADVLLLGGGGDAEITLLGFFLGGLTGGCGVLIAAGGFLQSGAGDRPAKLGRIFAYIVLAVILFFFLAYRSFTTPVSQPVRPGESISI